MFNVAQSVADFVEAMKLVTREGKEPPRKGGGFAFGGKAAGKGGKGGKAGAKGAGSAEKVRT